MEYALCIKIWTFFPQFVFACYRSWFHILSISFSFNCTETIHPLPHGPWLHTNWHLFNPFCMIQCIILHYILQCWAKGNDGRSMKALVLLLSSWATSHWDWGSAGLCCKSFYSHTFDFDWMFLVSLIIFLINLR